MRLKPINPEKELKKVQKKGIYNPKLKIVGIAGIIIGIALIYTTYAFFNYSSTKAISFNSQVDKKVNIEIEVKNGTTNNSKITTKYNQELRVKVNPNEGYTYESVVCTNSQTGTYDETNNELIIKPTIYTKCTVTFRETLRHIILASNVLKNNYQEKININTYNAGMWDNETAICGYEESFDSTTGLYTIEDISDCSITDKTDMFVCEKVNNTEKCTEIYQVIEMLTDSPGYKVNEFRSEEIPVDFTTGFPNENTSTRDVERLSGLYKAQDDDGDSYYFRGAVENNYVKFANKTWRVVRINGDKSIRLILNESNEVSGYGGNDRKKMGYTYDNIKPCTKEDPCKSEFNNVATSSTTSFINTHGGTNSIVKTFLENWYYNNLTRYDDKIVYSTFCNDTSININDDKFYQYYNHSQMYKNISIISLKCYDPVDLSGQNQNYGGVYKLKIGLITADELSMGGIATGTATNFNYLYHDNDSWTMTPDRFYHMNGERNEVIINSYGTATTLDSDYADVDATYHYNIYPVINLNSNVTITKGNGTQGNPYVIK